MSLLYTYGTGSVIESKRWSLLSELLDQIPNNNNNLILAKDVRDAVFTLWEKVNDSISDVYMNTSATPTTIGGIVAGSTFTTPQTMQQMFDKLLYPYLNPQASLNVPGLPNNKKEYGGSTAIALTWSVTRKTNPITIITVDGQSFTPTGNSQNGTKNTNGTYSVPEPASTVNTFNMSVSDGTSTTNSSANFIWMNRIYWGTINLTSIGNPDFGINPELVSNITLNSSIILALDGAGVSTGNELSESKSKTYTAINGSGKYLIFAWPTSTPGSLNPTFSVNGLQNTAFVKVKTNWDFTNALGFTTKYEVWMTNTRQNSSLDIKIT